MSNKKQGGFKMEKKITELPTENAEGYPEFNNSQYQELEDIASITGHHGWFKDQHKRGAGNGKKKKS